jgi:hypothetical protein
MRIAQLRLLLPARFAQGAALDAREIAAAVGRALQGAGAPPATLSVTLHGDGRTATALAAQAGDAAGRAAKER